MARFRHVQRGPELQKKLNRLRKGSDPAAQAGLLRAGEIISKEQKRLAPEQSGDLKDENQVALSRSSKTGNQSVMVYNSDFKAAWIEFGTAAHDIKPSNREALQLGPDEFVGGTVRHPGIKAQPFFFPGYRARRRAARAAIGKAIRDDIVKAAK